MAEHKSHQAPIHSEPIDQPQHPESTNEQASSRPSAHRRLSHAIQDLLFGHTKAHKHTVESQVDQIRPLNSTHNLKVEQKTITTTTISLEPTQDHQPTTSSPIPQQTTSDNNTSLNPPTDSQDDNNPLTRTLTRSPSIEAHETNTHNQNGFGDNPNPKPDAEQGYGWPGLGTWPSSSSHDKPTDSNSRSSQPTTRPQTQTQTHSTNPQTKKHDDKLEQVMRDAIDEAAGESYGWPGLGTWSSTPPRS